MSFDGFRQRSSSITSVAEDEEKEVDDSDVSKMERFMEPIKKAYILKDIHREE